MQEFEMKDKGVSCTQCGKDIPFGAPVFAPNYDKARNGGGLCAKCAAPPKAEPPKKPEPTKE